MPVRPETSKRQNRFKIERNMLEEEVVKKFYGENELRRMYLEFFESKGHLKMNSFSLVPHNDNMFLSILNLFCLFDVSGLTGILSILAVAQLLSRKNSKSRHHDQNHENQYIMYKPSQKCHSQVLPFPNSSHPV